VDRILDAADLRGGRFVVLQKGKRHFAMLEIR
jgi:hypothetical protein